MKKRNLSDFLQDILDGITEIESFTEDVDLNALAANREKTLAVVKLLEILGEAVKKIPNEIKSRYPDVKWRGLAGMRDILVHAYWKIDIEVVWASIQEDVPVLKQAVSQIMGELEDGR